MPLINELKPQETIRGTYLCKFKQILKNKNGKDYCSVRLQDRTGNLDGKIWSLHSGISAFEVDDIVEVEGETLLYQENLQLNITKVTKLESGYDLKDFIPHTKKDVTKLQERLMQFIDEVENQHIKKLLEEINITTNKNMIPNDTLSPKETSGLRIGFAAVTTRGCNKENAIKIATLIHGYLNKDISQEEAKLEVEKLVNNWKIIEEI